MTDRFRPFTSRVSSFVSQVRAGPPPSPAGDGPSTWGQWAGQKLKQITRGDTPQIETLYIFPGWATRRYKDSRGQITQGSPFDIEVSVYGWAASHNAPDTMTRSQKAFIRLAKGYAALPKLPTVISGASDELDTHMSKSTEDLIKSLHLPPPPSHMKSEEDEIAALEEQMRRTEISDSDLLPASMASSSSIPLATLHSNLEARILPFWSSALANRTVRLSLLVTNHSLVQGTHNDTYFNEEPVVVQQTSTSQDGSFNLTFIVPWERMCTHQRALHIAYGDSNYEHELVVHAELLAPFSHPREQPQQIRIPREPLPTVASVATPVSLSYSPVRVISDIDDTVKHSHILSGARSVFYNVFVRDLGEAVIPEMAKWYNDMWQLGVRFHYVSNGPFELLPIITDFFKLSELPAGSLKLRSYAGRSLFNGIMAAPMQRKRANVVEVLDHFPLSRFILIGDSGEQDLELYAQLAQERPRQILAVFIRDVHVGDGTTPPLEDPTGTKRNDSSSSFSAPRFPSTAAPGAYRRTASSSSSTTVDTLQRPAPVLYAPYRPRSRAGSGSSFRSQTPSVGFGDEHNTMARSPVGTSYSTAFSEMTLVEEPDQFGVKSSQVSLPSPLPLPSPVTAQEPPPMTEPERRQWDLQQRVNRARALMPAQVPLRIFRHPSECVEAKEILDGFQVGMKK